MCEGPCDRAHRGFEKLLRTGHVGTKREDAEWSHTAQIDMPSFFLPRSLIENKSLATLLSVTHSQKR